jgi:hypothetical protein
MSICGPIIRWKPVPRWSLVLSGASSSAARGDRLRLRQAAVVFQGAQQRVLPEHIGDVLAVDGVAGAGGRRLQVERIVRIDRAGPRTGEVIFRSGGGDEVVVGDDGVVDGHRAGLDIDAGAVARRRA